VLVTPAQGDDRKQRAGLKERHELASLRTESSKTYVNPDGSFVTSVFANPIHFRNAERQWLEIDTDLKASGKSGYLWQIARAGYTADFRQKSEENLLSFTTGARVAFTLTPEGAGTAPSSKAKRNKLVYQNSWPNADLEYVLQPDGVKETIVLKKGAAARYDFTLRPTGEAKLTAVANNDGSVSFFADKAGAPAFVLQAPVVSESARPAKEKQSQRPDLSAAPEGSTPEKGGKAPTEPRGDAGEMPAAAGKAQMGVERQQNGSFRISVRVDENWLDDPERVFPVYLDPTISTQADVQDGYWDTASPVSTPNMSSSELFAGYDGNGANNAAAIKFNLGVVPPGARVTAAKVNVHATRCVPTSTGQYASYGCPFWWPGSGGYSSTMQLYQINAPGWSSSTQWQNVSVDSTSLGSFSGQFYQSTGTTIPRTFSLTNNYLTQKVQAIIAGDAANHGFLLKKTAGDATGLAFASSRYPDVLKAPRLDIEWVADGVQLYEPSHVHSNGAELVWQSYNGGKGPYAKEVLEDSPAAYWRLSDPADSPFGQADWSGNNQFASPTAGVARLEPGATSDGDRSV
jgi:hypothetical protein